MFSDGKMQLKNSKSKALNFKFNRQQKDQIFAITLLIPVFLILATVMFAPIIKGIWMSFYDYTLATMKHPTWNNFENYKSLFRSKEIFVYTKNTLIYVFSTVSIQLIIAMSIALLLNSKIRGRNIFRGLFLISWTIPSVVVALLWSWLLQPQYGVLNYIFSQLGIIGDMNTQWVQNPKMAMLSVIIAATWKQGPYMIIMILAGLQSVSTDIQEAAEIDGASKIKVFQHVTIPSMRPVLDTTVLIAIMNNFQMFTIIYNMTSGGPMDRTTTLSIGAYLKAFTEYDLGSGSAIGVMWLVLLFTFITVYNKMTKKNKTDLI